MDNTPETIIDTLTDDGILPTPKKGSLRGLLGTVLGFVAALTVISAVLLTIRLVDYVKRDDREVLLQSGFDKQLEIFSIQYSNESGELSVVGLDGKSVIAPGTKVEYTIRLRNKDDIAIDYEIAPIVTYTSEHIVPIRLRMIDDDGNYLLGDAKTWAAVEDIESLSEKSTLVKGDSSEYIFQWKWAFDSGDDAYDTFLGSLARDEEFGVTVSFDLRAEANTSIGANGGVRESGLGDILVTAFALALLAASTTLMIVYFVKKHMREKALAQELPAEEASTDGDETV